MTFNPQHTDVAVKVTIPNKSVRTEGPERIEVTGFGDIVTLSQGNQSTTFSMPDLVHALSILSQQAEREGV